jgi:signal transduction histidine kinase/ligand-binding sensor domain-containing protein
VLDARAPGRCAFAWVTLLAAALSPAAAAALEPGRRFDQYVHAAWPSVAHASSVYAVTAAPDGHLWVGTSEGLVRFDGPQVTTYEGQHRPGVADHNLRALLEARDGTLWIGSFGRGLARLRAGRIVPVAAAGRDGEGPAGRHLLALVESEDGTVWAAGRAGVTRFAGAGDEVGTPTSDGLPARCTHALALARGAPGVAAGAGGAREQLYAGTHGGLARWTGQAWVPEALPAPGVAVDALVAEPDGTLWVGTRGAGLWQRRAGRWRNFSVAAGLGSNEVTALLRDRAGHLWVATRAALTFAEGDRFRALALPPALCPDRVQALAEDAEGGLWLGTERCGLHRLADRPFRTLTAADGLPSDLLLGLGAAGNGDLLVGTRGGGTARLRAGQPRLEPLACAPGLPCHQCWDFSGLPADDGLWTVCQQNVVLRWDGRQMTRAGPLPGGLPGASFALQARDGAVWFALDRQVVRAHGGAVTSIAPQERFEGYRILHEGRDGTVWIAADDGLASWRAGQTRLVRLPPAERPAEVANFLEDDDGTLWMATKGEGIRRLRPGSDHVATVGVGQGLPSSWIVQLLPDRRGRLWASSSRGIFWVARAELHAVADGRRPRLEPRLYDGGDGIQMSSEPFGHPAGHRDAQGRLWFVTNGGLVVIDPDAPGARAPAPRVAVQQWRLGGQRLPLNGDGDGDGGRPPVAEGPRDLDVSFAALTFAGPDTVSYRYRLQGHGDDWIEIGPRRSLHQPALPPGAYRLAIQARTREGDWGPETAALAFTLRPPFHRSPAFALLLAAAAGLLLLAAHRARLAQTRARLEAVMAERTRIAREIHDTLAQAFAATSVQLECLEDALDGAGAGAAAGARAAVPAERAPDKVRRHLDTAKQVVEESLEEARQAVWVLRPQAIEPGLVPALETLARRLSGGVPVRLQVSGAARTLPPLVASNLLRIAHEAVANARRHARARTIDVGLVFAPASVRLTIADDGAGLSPPAHARGVRDGSQGLLGMQERAAQIGGRLTVESGPERGTRVAVEVAA